MKLEPWQHHHTLLDSVLHPGESLQFRPPSLGAKSTRKSQEHIIPSPQENVVHFSSEPIQIPRPAVRRRLRFSQSSYDEPSLDSGVFSPSSWKPEMQQIIPEDDDVFEAEFGSYGSSSMFVFDHTPTTPHDHFFQPSLSRTHSVEQGDHSFSIQSNATKERMSAISKPMTSSTVKMNNGEEHDKTLPLQIQRQRASSLHSPSSVSDNSPKMESTNSCHSICSYNNRERTCANRTLYTFGTPMIERGISAREILVSTTHEKERRSK